ncbi:MerR family transcriptional regulator [Streptosporangium sp. KLBMP 9127]|nr:helix-turn-helix domain-containing protein [Streptosporangium sp. KLBMP 9127]
MSETWTIRELAERATDALRAASGSPVNGRVREVPGERLIRWYTTIGLVDPPLTRRGRIALYGRRHLLQLVAIKRLQAAGNSIAAIQADLAGATDAQLAGAAGLPEPETATPRPARDRFWAERPQTPTGLVHGVRLAPGVTVVLDGASRTPSPDDMAALVAAAGPLLAALGERGLTEGSTP